MSILYRPGDVTTAPAGSILMHCCNNRGAWGAGVVLSISRMSKNPETEYRKWAQRYADSDELLPLGRVQFVKGGDLIVANMIGQTLGHEYPPVKYWAIAEALVKVGEFADSLGRPIVAPMFGAGLAGGDWLKIETLIETHIPDHIPVTIYDFELKERMCTFPPDYSQRCKHCEIVRTVGQVCPNQILSPDEWRRVRG